MRIAVDILVTKSSRRAASPMLETDVVVKMGRGVGVVGRAPEDRRAPSARRAALVRHGGGGLLTWD
jgi:hypothetical protein